MVSVSFSGRILAGINSGAEVAIFQMRRGVVPPPRHCLSQAVGNIHLFERFSPFAGGFNLLYDPFFFQMFQNENVLSAPSEEFFKSTSFLLGSNLSNVKVCD